VSAGDSQSGGAGGSGNSFAAQHQVAPRRALNVAPTDGSTKFNTIRIPLIPVACRRLNDPAFVFDSSFVGPNFKDEIGALAGIIGANEGCPAAIFGHCDPAGSDTLNKSLGDRRAIAIYALVTRQPDLWAWIHDNSQVGDTWDLRMVQTMLGSVPDRAQKPYLSGESNGVQGADTTDAVKRFQTDAGLAADGDPGSNTRKALYGAYMDWLCTADGGSTPFRMQPTDFLGGAGASQGDLPKMSLQSCGKYNPIVLLTAADMNGPDLATRNAHDAPNRRVLMFLFQKGVTVGGGGCGRAPR
jgi:outer membrane protein OmpA-like peptidoglycan-associated protein